MVKNYFPTYFITSASVVDNTLVLVVNGNPSMSEHVHFVLRFAPRVAIPSGLASDTPVSISIGGTSYNIENKYGEDISFKDLPKDSVNDNYFSPRYAMVGGVGSSTVTSGDETTTTYYYIVWNIPLI